jgi:hypothetical protein
LAWNARPAKNHRDFFEISDFPHLIFLSFNIVITLSLLYVTSQVVAQKILSWILGFYRQAKAWADYIVVLTNFITHLKDIDTGTYPFNSCEKARQRSGCDRANFRHE